MYLERHADRIAKILDDLEDMDFDLEDQEGES